MNVSLTPELEEYVASQVSTGRYRSTSEFIRECVRLKMDQDELRRLKLEALRRDIDQGLADLARGDWVDGDVAFELARKTIREKDDGC